MDLVASLPGFVVAVVLLSASPGPAVALILRRAAVRGLSGAVPVVLGLEAGLYLWAMMAGAGLAALVAASEAAYLALRITGSVALVFLGIRLWLRRHLHNPDPVHYPDPAAPRTWWSAFGEGLAVQLANPKAAAFMVAFYPQFIPPDQPFFAATAALAMVQVTLETVIYLALAAGVARAERWFRQPAIRRRLDAVTGAVLVGVGVRVALTDR